MAYTNEQGDEVVEEQAVDGAGTIPLAQEGAPTDATTYQLTAPILDSDELEFEEWIEDIFKHVWDYDDPAVVFTFSLLEKWLKDTVVVKTSGRRRRQRRIFLLAVLIRYLDSSPSLLVKDEIIKTHDTVWENLIAGGPPKADMLAERFLELYEILEANPNADGAVKFVISKAQEYIKAHPQVVATTASSSSSASSSNTPSSPAKKQDPCHSAAQKRHDKFKLPEGNLIKKGEALLAELSAIKAESQEGQTDRIAYYFVKLTMKPATGGDATMKSAFELFQQSNSASKTKLQQLVDLIVDTCMLPPRLVRLWDKLLSVTTHRKFTFEGFPVDRYVAETLMHADILTDHIKKEELSLQQTINLLIKANIFL